MMTRATACRRLASVDPAAGYAAIFAGWQREHRFTVRWLTQCPDHVGPFACWRTRSVTLYPFTAGDPDERIAEAAHEVGHLLAGLCPGSAPHGRHRGTRSVECVRCEVLATELAIQLVQRAWVPWSRAMHERLTCGLRSYRRVPTTAADLHQLDALCGLGYFQAQQEFLMQSIPERTIR